MKSIKKLVFTLVFILTSTVWVAGQSMYGDKVKYDVKMKYVNTLEEAMMRAKAENKLIFFNCFADWALPCHAMNKHVFSNAQFSEYMNKTFVNLFIDVSAREHTKLVEKYKIDFFAHYLVLDADGNIVHRIVGGGTADEMKEMMELALNPKTSMAGMNKRYDNGERGRDFLRNYAKVLIAGGERVKADDIVNQYIAKTDKSEMWKAENWFVVRRMSAGVGSEWFNYVVANKAAFVKGNGLELINGFISGGYSMMLLPYAVDSKGYTKEKLNEIGNALTSAGVNRPNKVYIYFDLAMARGEKRYADYINLLRTRGNEIDDVVTDNVVFSVAKMLDASPEDMKLIIAYLSDKEAAAQSSNKKHYQAAIASMTAKNSGIIFEEGTFAEALKKAKAANKPLFLDAYTSWCGPCKTMSDQVFTQEAVGVFFEKNFVAIKVDMEKGEGIELAKQYNISIYPTMMIIDGEGKEVHRILGACSPAEFVHKLEVGLNPESCLANVKAKYDAGDRTPIVVCNYIQAMEIAGEMKNGKLKAEEFFFSLSKKEQISAGMKPMFHTYANTPTDRLTVFMMANKAAYTKVLSADEMDKMLERIYFPALLGAVKVSDAEGTKSIIAQLDKAKVNEKSVIGLFVRLAKQYLKQNMSGIIEVYKKEVANMSTNPQGKLNLDMLVPVLLRKASVEQVAEIKSYIQEQSAKADTRAKNGYVRLLGMFE